MSDGASTTAAARPLRVLWLIKGLQVGGIERLLCWAAAHRDQQRFECQAVYLFHRLDGLAGHLEREGIRVRCLEARHELDLVWALRLRRLLAAHPVDVVHLHSAYAAGIARLVALSLPRRLRPRLVSTEHNVWRDYALPTKIVNALTYPLDDAHVAVSDAVRRSIPRPLRRDVEVVVHGVQVEHVRRHLESRQTARTELGVAADEVAVVTIANIRAQKGYRDLLLAARAVLDTGLPVRFFSVGQGPLESEIADLHRSLGFGDRFVFLGFREDAIHVLAACDLFALASLYEGGPIAVIEALAMGLPVVATRVGVVPDVVTDGVEGRVVPPARPDLLAAAIRQLVESPARRAKMAEAAFRRGAELDVSHTVRRVEAIYCEVTEAGTAKNRRADL